MVKQFFVQTCLNNFEKCFLLAGVTQIYFIVVKSCFALKLDAAWLLMNKMYKYIIGIMYNIDTESMKGPGV